MSLTSKFDGLNESEGKEDKKPQAEGKKTVDLYAKEGHTRNVSFVDASGKCTFLNYSYLIAGEYTPEENTITLSYTTHTVTLKGSNLEKLNEQLSTQMPEKIRCINERYAATKGENEVLILEMSIKKIEA